MDTVHDIAGERDEDSRDKAVAAADGLQVAALDDDRSSPTFNQAERLIGAIKEMGGEVGAYADALSRGSGVYSRPTFSQFERLIEAVRNTLSIAEVKKVLPLDGTLALAGKAADAKAVGDKKVSKSGDTITGKLKVTAAIENGHVTASAPGTNAHAEGMESTAAGECAHAEGYKTKAIGIESHAEGYCSVAKGSRDHAEGRSAQASGNQCHAEGYWTVAEGDRTHAEGVECLAGSYYSHAEGAHTHAEGAGSHAEGWCTHTQRTAAHATGTFANAKDNYSFVFSGVFQNGVERWTATQRNITPETGSSDYRVPRQDAYTEGSIVVCHGFTFVAKKDVQPGVMPPVEGVKRDPKDTFYVYWKLAEGYESDENWQYLGQSKMYESHGDGTFNINPNGGPYLPAYGMYIGDSRLPAVIAELMVNPSSTTPYPRFSESTAYSVGDFVVYNGFLYRFKKDHAAGAWNIGDVTWFGVSTALSTYVNGGSYDSTQKKILLKNGNNTVAEIDVTEFIKDIDLSAYAKTAEVMPRYRSADDLQVEALDDGGTSPLEKIVYTYDDYDRAMEDYIRQVRVDRGYTLREPSDYKDDPYPRFAQDALDFIAFRSAVMVYALPILNEYKATGNAPSFEDFKAGFPKITWTYSDEVQ